MTNLVKYPAMENKCSKKNKLGVFVAATGQNVGKTTLCLGIFSGLKKKFGDVGFIKPVGQQHIEVEQGLRVDKDVVLMKKQFCLPHRWDAMSPVIIPAGFTRKFLDKEISVATLREKIVQGFATIASENVFTLVEGTGHVGVGSIVQLSNATVAHLLGLDMVIIASGGLGSSFDEIAMNKALCDHLGVRVRGVILNRVLPEKKAMIEEYFPKALQELKIPLIGCIPFDPLLSRPSLQDIAQLFAAEFLSGFQERYRHFESTFLITQESHLTRKQKTLWVVSSTYPKLIDWVLQEDNGCALLITGKRLPDALLLEKIAKTSLPVLYCVHSSLTVMQKLTSFHGKIEKEDASKVEEAMQVVEKNMDFEKLCEK